MYRTPGLGKILIAPLVFGAFALGGSLLVADLSLYPLILSLLILLLWIGIFLPWQLVARRKAKELRIDESGIHDALTQDGIARSDVAFSDVRQIHIGISYSSYWMLPLCWYELVVVTNSRRMYATPLVFAYPSPLRMLLLRKLAKRLRRFLPNHVSISILGWFQPPLNAEVQETVKRY